MNVSKSTQTNIDMFEISKLYLDLVSKTDLISKMLKTQICSKAINKDDAKTHYYTGLLSYRHFEIIVSTVKPYVKVHGNYTLIPEDQILLTLMKLRLSLDYTDLGYRFGISSVTASFYFKTIVHIMYMRFKSLIIWPERAVLRKTMPKCFRESFHDQTTIIIDCFEIKCQRPSNLLAAAQSWSNYKHSQTIKYLIGITPQGSISYISEGWGGRISDKYITQNSTFLNNLCPGDIVMADRGFLIKEFVELFQATVKIPAFTRGKDQLHPVDLESTRAIAHVRIHVERVIGTIRQKYRILNGPLPIHLLASRKTNALVDEVVLVCCALVNLCPSVVPL